MEKTKNEINEIQEEKKNTTVIKSSDEDLWERCDSGSEYQDFYFAINGRMPW